LTCRLKHILLLFLLCIPSLVTRAQHISTFAGTKGVKGFAGDGGVAIRALLNYPYKMTMDEQGNMYVVDHPVVRKISTDGIITTIAGNGTAGYSGDGGPATAARIDLGTIAVDKAGNIYLTDANHFVIRKINTAGIITTIAGNGSPVFMGDGGPATIAGIDPGDMEVDDAGNIYLCEYLNARIRKINTAGIISTVAGNGIKESSNASGIATNIPVLPGGIGLDKAGNIYFTDNDRRVRKINAAGIITTIAGTTAAGYGGDGGPATNALLNQPYDVHVDEAGNIYISDRGNHRIRKINPVGMITTFAGNGVQGYSNDGVLATAASTTFPNGLAIDKAGNVYFAETDNFAIRKVTVCIAPLQPSIMITASATHIQAGTPVTFSATIGNGGNDPAFQWLVNGERRGTNSALFTTDALEEDDAVSCILTSSIGCTDPVISNGLTIQVKYKKIQMPTAFSPNRDQKNESFRIPAGTSFKLSSFTIYNRWGELVFKTNNIRQGWDGTQHGIPASAGLYVYAIAGRDRNKETVVKGTVFLVR